MDVDEPFNLSKVLGPWCCRNSDKFYRPFAQHHFRDCLTSSSTKILKYPNSRCHDNHRSDITNWLKIFVKKDKLFWTTMDNYEDFLTSLEHWDRWRGAMNVSDHFHTFQTVQTRNRLIEKMRSRRTHERTDSLRDAWTHLQNYHIEYSIQINLLSID